MKNAHIAAAETFSFTAFAEFAKLGKKVGFGGPPDIHLDFDHAGFVAHGDTVPGANGWQVIHAPGHTDDSTCSTSCPVCSRRFGKWGNPAG